MSARDSKYHIVIFDVDDTFIYRPTYAVRKANNAALKLLCSPTRGPRLLKSELTKVYIATTQGKSTLVSKRSQFAMLLSGLNYDYDVERLFTAYVETYISMVSLSPDIITVLSFLQESGVNVGIASNGPGDSLNALLKFFALDGYFDFVVSSSQVGFPKPSAQFAAYLHKQCFPSSGRILIVGDGEEDSITAKMIGADFALFRLLNDYSSSIDALYRLQSLNDVKSICRGE